MRKGKGFTLVELLIVIAIVGILASIILASMQSSRNRAKDSAIIQSLRDLRSVAELHYNENYTYVGVCNSADNTITDTGNFGRLEGYVNENIGTGVLTCNDDLSGYAVIADLHNGNCWCVDYQGAGEVIPSSGNTCANVLGTNTQCPN